MTRRLIATLLATHLTVVAAVALAPATSLAQDDGAIVDPNGPAGKEYQIPIEQGRSEGDGSGSRGSSRDDSKRSSGSSGSGGGDSQRSSGSSGSGGGSQPNRSSGEASGSGGEEAPGGTFGAGIEPKSSSQSKPKRTTARKKERIRARDRNRADETLQASRPSEDVTTTASAAPPAEEGGLGAGAIVAAIAVLALGGGAGLLIRRFRSS